MLIPYPPSTGNPPLPCFFKFWNTLFGMARSHYSSIFFFISSIISNRVPFKAAFSFRNKKSLLGLSLGNWMCVGGGVILFLPQRTGVTRAGVLSCCNTHVCSFHRSGLASSCILLSTSALKLPYNTLCLLSDHMERSHDEPTLSS